MAFYRELHRPAASFPVYFSLFYLLNLNFVYPKCQKSFQCGHLGRLEFPLSNYTQPECGLFRVQCDAIPYPLVYLEYQGISSSREILSKISTHVFRIRNPTLEGLLKSKSCALFNNYSILGSPSISFSVLPNITLFKCAKTSTPYFPDDYKKYTGCQYFDIYYAVKIKNMSCPDECSVFHLPGELKNESDSTDLFDQLSPEYNLQWFLSVDCAECHNKGGQCTTTRKNEFICEKAAGRSKLKLIFVAGASATALVLFSVILFTFKKRKYMMNLKGKKQNQKDIELFLKKNKNLAPRRYNYSDLKKMTNSFRDKLGEGGFASVYRGKLPDDHLVAVKILKEMKGNGEEFINEVASISRTSHVNIVTLLGFCFEGSKRALIYEFVPNGSLEKFIGHNNSIAERQLGLEKLFQIAVGIAQGIEYLHQGCNTRILHFDIKPHNILLDQDFNPKISDFGLARLCLNRSSIVSMSGARGTIGYIAPEIFCRNFGDVSHKSDVYSYGMMILEMAGETKNIEVRVDHSSENYFPDWIYKNLEQNAELDLNIIMNANEHLMTRKMLIVGLWCIQTDPTIRPSMSRVVEMLEGNIESLQIPPKPNFILQRGEAVNPSTFELSLSSSDAHEVKL